MQSDARILAARSLVASALGEPVEKIGESGGIDTAPGWDSLGHVRVLLAIEASLGRSLAPAEVVSVRGVADVARLLEVAA